MSAERLSSSIFDQLDSGRIAQAEGALESALQKFPKDECLRVADALLNVRQNNFDLARTKANQLSKEKLTNPRALNALVHVLQQCCSWEALATTFERLRPLQDDKKISENLMQTYVRMGSYEKAQQLSMSLFRQYKEPKYQVWMVQSALAQVPLGSTDHLGLKLSTKLFDSAVLTEKGLVTPSTTQTYVDVLVQQGDYRTAVDFLQSPRGAKIGLLARRLEVLSRVLRKAGEDRQANAVAKHLWRIEPDNWNSYELYRDALLSSSSSPSSSAAASSEVLELTGEQPELCATIHCSAADSTLEAAIAYAKELQHQEEAAHPTKLRRGPFLAELDLIHRQGGAAALSPAVLAYVGRFYRKPCCYLDVSTFLSPALAEELYAWSLPAGDAAAGAAGDALAMHARRILGLRCRVACLEAAATPPAVVEELVALCKTGYEAAKPLSESLAWSEEGLCDGYITTALNVFLRGYASRAASSTPPRGLYAMQALELLHTVDRPKNNPTWLIFRAAFAALLGLADCAALDQLAFKSVQHDTMAHIGYWPLRVGLALDDVASWEEWAEDYFTRLERDCSLLRAKVFTFTSWPAMQDVQRYEWLQENSYYRWQYAPQECAAALLDCQTQKDVLSVFVSRTGGLWATEEKLRAVSMDKVLVAKDCSGQETGWLVDNTDWAVAKSAVLGDIHSASVDSLTRTLLRVPSAEEQLPRLRQLLHSLFLLHDVAVTRQYRDAEAQASKMRKGKKNAAAAGTASTTPLPTLYTTRMEKDQLTCLPVLQCVAPGLLAYVRSSTPEESPTPCDAEAFAAALQEVVASCTAKSSSTASFSRAEEFIYPEAYVLSALLKVCPAGDPSIPLQRLASAFHDALVKIRSHYHSVPAAVVTDAEVREEMSAGAVAVPAAESAVGHLMQEKRYRVLEYLATLAKDAEASSRRK